MHCECHCASLDPDNVDWMTLFTLVINLMKELLEMLSLVLQSDALQSGWITFSWRKLILIYSVKGCMPGWNNLQFQIFFIIISQPCQIIIINIQEHWNFNEKLGLKSCDIIIDPEPRTCLKSVIVSLPPSSLPGNVDRIDEDDVIRQDFQSHFVYAAFINYLSFYILPDYVCKVIRDTASSSNFQIFSSETLSLQIETRL